MRVFKNTLVAATLLLSITSAQAALVESNWKNTSDALATLDTETGIEWLDLTNTRGQSINGIEDLMGQGGRFEGWRVATSTEVIQMIAKVFVSQPLITDQDPGNYNFNDITTNLDVRRFTQKFGVTYAQNNSDRIHIRNYTWGLYKDDSGQVFFSGVYDTLNNYDVGLYLNRSQTADYHSTKHAVYLVSDGGTTLSSQLDPSINNVSATNVSAPALLGWMSLGLFGFAARRRNTK